MNSINSWCAMLCSLIVASAAFEFLIPPGKISKSVNVVLGSLVILLLMTPFTFKSKMKKIDLEKLEEKNISKKLSSISNVSEQQTMDIAKKNVEAIIRGVLKDNNIIFKKIEIFMDRNQDNCILMIRCKIYVPQNEQDSEEKIKKEIENKLNIKTQVIFE